MGLCPESLLLQLQWPTQKSLSYDTHPGGGTTVNIEFIILCKGRAKYYLFQNAVTMMREEREMFGHLEKDSAQTL